MSTSATRAAGTKPLSGLLFATGFAVVASACTTTPTPDQMARTTLETAPADLQLLCANEAARSAGVEAGKVLPVSSRKLDAKNYQVELNAGGKPTTCVIDADGRIVSVRAA
jgi:hypothetical protein